MYTEDIYTFINPKNVDFYIDLAGISYCDDTYYIERNISENHVFEYIIKGSGTLQHDNDIYYPKAGDFYILRAGSYHKYYPDPKDPWIKIWVNLRGDFFNHILSAYGLSYTVHIKDYNNQTIMKQIIDIAKSNSDTKCKDIAILLHKQIIDLSEFLDMTNSIKDENALKIRNYISSHISENITIKTLSDLIYLSPSQTINIFKKSFGCTPYDYSLEIKINTAKLLLKNTSLSIKEIASKVGFSDAHYFSNFFKLKIGVSPKQFRSETKKIDA